VLFFSFLLDFQSVEEMKKMKNKQTVLGGESDEQVG
jgi:hypothetical protein